MYNMSVSHDISLQSAARGMLVGLAVGDALGANLEFTIFHHSEITDDKIAMYDGMWPKGAWTDDTSMALCLAHSLLDARGYDSYDAMDKYRRWVEEGYCSYDYSPAADVGIQTQAAITRFKQNPIIDEYDQRSDRAGNGTLMRLAPVVIATSHLPIPDTVKLAQISARETHYSLEVEAATEVFAAILRQALSLQDKSDIIHAAQYTTGEIYDDILNRALQGSESNRRVMLEDLGGYAVDALSIALWGFRNFASFEDGMRAVIKLGGDTDTNGAIYGQLAGAYYGYEAIPEKWRQNLLRETEIRDLADDLLQLSSCPIIKTRFQEDEI